jgi:hypothetical protein
MGLIVCQEKVTKLIELESIEVVLPIREFGRVQAM